MGKLTTKVESDTKKKEQILKEAQEQIKKMMEQLVGVQPMTENKNSYFTYDYKLGEK